MKNRLGGFIEKQPISGVSWTIDSTPSDNVDMEWLNATTIGTCSDLEKKYLRLTTVISNLCHLFTHVSQKC